MSARIGALVEAGPPPGIGAVAWRRTARLYRTVDAAPFWHQASGAPSPRVELLVRAVARAEAEGLRPADYPLHAIELARAAGSRGATVESIAHLDVLVSATFAAFASDLLTGRLSPRNVEPGWHIDAEAVDVDSALAATLRAPDLTAALERLRPRADGYEALVAGLARYRLIVRRGGWADIPPGPPMRVGDTTERVIALRYRLAAEEMTTRPSDVVADRVFDHELAADVARFQARHGIDADSIVGPRTQAALNVTAEHRLRQIVANLERLRWLPPRLGERYVLVNLPAFRLDAFEGGRSVLAMRVIVGADYGRRNTPIFSDSMRYVVFHPYWNVPASIAVSEVLPAARRDPAYLGRNRYEIVRGWGKDSRVVRPAVLRSADFRAYRYRIRQRPGADNALGMVKFMFPNDYNVYLHDTPQDSLFAATTRAFSHGCVRVERPAALARFVLGPQGVDSAAVDAALQSGTHRRVDLARSIPVYLVYLTAFASSDTVVSFRDDLYGSDAPLLQALEDG